MNRKDKITLLSKYGSPRKENPGGRSLIHWKLININGVSIGGLICSDEEKSFNNMYNTVERWMWQAANDPLLEQR